MCGIAGFVNYKEDNWNKVIENMKNMLIHRGPNGDGTWHDEHVVFGHRRLSIVDLSINGSQPMISRNNRFVLTYNGELYNKDEITKKYNLNKNELKGTSDTEVLLEAIAKSDLQTVLRDCRGMFALALYDREKKIVNLARDRMGEKPLYYGYVQNTLVFASDLKCFEVFPEFERVIDKEALGLYMKFSYIPAPFTIYKKICKLEQGSMATIHVSKDREIHIQKYWSVIDAVKKGQKNLFRGNSIEAQNQLKEIFHSVIKSQMVADVPVGAFLSGGIDSSTVVSIMQSLQSGKVETFTIGVDDAINEAERAKKIASYLGTSHNELYVNSKDCINVIANLGDIYSEPFADATAIPSVIVSQLAKKKVTVCLSGDGGDELFCGYTLYDIVARNWSKAKSIPYSLRNNIGKLLQHTTIKGAKIGYYLQAATAYQLAEQYLCGWQTSEKLVIGNECKTDYYKTKEFDDELEVLENLMILDQQLFLPDSHMVKMDRASMNFSLETRAPFLDKDIVEFAWSLPLQYKFNNGNMKDILKKVAYEFVPKELLDMPKQGFSIPIYKWVKDGELNEWAYELLNERRIKEQGILDEKLVSQMWNSYIKNDNNYYWKQIWNILMFEQWGLQRGL